MGFVFSLKVTGALQETVWHQRARTISVATADEISRIWSIYSRITYLYRANGHTIWKVLHLLMDLAHNTEVNR